MVEISLRKAVRLKAYAKVNLHLDVGPKRSDGFHDIATVFQTVELADEIDLEWKQNGGIIFESDSAIPWNETNTVFLAVKEIEKLIEKKLNMKIVLKKNIPAGGGLGGGSSDAAIFLRYLGKFFKIPRHKIFEAATLIGSDVPFFLQSGTSVAFGRGERLLFPGDLSGYSVSMAFPDSRVLTGWAYKQIDNNVVLPGINKKKAFELYEKLALDSNDLRKISINTFEKPVFSFYKDIKKTFVEFSRETKAILTRMSGSGSTIYNLFRGGTGDYGFVTSEEVKVINDL